MSETLMEIDGVATALDERAKMEAKPKPTGLAAVLKSVEEELHFAAGDFEEARLWRTAKRLEEIRREVLCMMELVET